MPTEPQYLPYVNAYGGISKLFAEIKSASVPAKFTQDFMNTALGLRSSSYRAMIPLLKKLGFIDQGNVPTQAYKDFRDRNQSGAVVARQIRDAYSSLFEANEHAYKLDKKELQAKLTVITGAAEDDPVVSLIAATFLELSKHANWTAAVATTREEVKTPPTGKRREAEEPAGIPGVQGRRVGISYTINLNLPATTEIEVFNAIFRSLRDNLLREL